MSKTVQVSVSCNWCETEAPEPADGWEVDLPVRVGDGPTRALDLCPNCLAVFMELVNSGEIVKRVYRPKHMEVERSARLKYKCEVCPRSFPTVRGRGMHYVRMHGLTFEGGEK